jgi:hypothetical protein
MKTVTQQVFRGDRVEICFSCFAPGNPYAGGTAHLALVDCNGAVVQTFTPVTVPSGATPVSYVATPAQTATWPLGLITGDVRVVLAGNPTVLGFVRVVVCESSTIIP